LAGTYGVKYNTIIQSSLFVKVYIYIYIYIYTKTGFDRSINYICIRT